jgi:dTDP-4-amino-4,6-dideoxygalactose transaminase
VGTRHAVTMASGTDALLAGFMALGLGPGDEVLCPSFTFFATAGCISRTGATPVFCDVSAADFGLDVADAESRITARTKAVVPVHLFGQAADMAAVGLLAARHGLEIVEDVAQAIGGAHHGRGVGTIGRMGCFSFFPSKNLGGFGDGGLVTTDDDALAEKLRQLRNHGMHPKYHHAMIGGNFRMDALQCALLRIKLPHLQTYAAGRRRNAAHYLERLSRIPGVVGGASPDAAGARLILPFEQAGNHHVWNQFTLRVPGAGRRDALRDFLAARDIGSEIYYPVPLHRQECFANLSSPGSADCPVSERLSGEVLSIPVYPELLECQLDEVAAAIEEWLDSQP